MESIQNQTKSRFIQQTNLFNQNYYNPTSAILISKTININITQGKQNFSPLMITKPTILTSTQSKPTPAEPIQQSDFQYVLNLNDLMDYFKSIRVSSVSEKKSDFYAYEKFINVTEQIYNDEVEVANVCVNVDSLLVKEKISQQEEKANELKAKKSQILQQLALLDSHVSRSKRQSSHSKGKINLSMDVSRVSSKDNEQQQDQAAKKLIFSKQQHKQLVLKIVKQRQQRQRKRLLMKQKQQQKLKKLQEEQSQIQAKKAEEERKKKAEEIEEKLKRKREMHEKFLQEEKQSQRKVQEIKQRKFLYQEISQKFQLKVKMPLLQQQKKLLRQKRQFAKAYSIDQIKSHQKAYLQLRQNSMKKSQAKQVTKPTDLSYKAPAKSSRLERILQEEQLEKRKKLMEKKRAIEEKLQRQENYVDYLKENFSKIKIDKSKQEEIKKRIEKMTVKHQEIDSRAIGMSYLQQAKKLRKKTAQHGHDTQKQQSPNQNQKNVTVLSQPKKPPTQSRVENMRRNNLAKKRQQKIQILIHDSTLNETEKIKKLKMETQKINQAFKMKEQMLKYGYSEKVEVEAVELLLTSIQAKMGIIDITKERDGVVS